MARSLLSILFFFSISIAVAQSPEGGEGAVQEGGEEMNTENPENPNQGQPARNPAGAAAGDTAKVEARVFTEYEQAVEYWKEAEALKEQRRYEEALEKYNDALELDPNLVEAYVGRGGIKFLNVDFEGAMQDYNKAIEIGENLIEFHDYRQKIKTVLEDFEGAKIEGSKVQFLKEQMAEALYRRGSLKRFKEDYSGSCEDLERAKDLGNLRAKTDIKAHCQ